MRINVRLTKRAIVVEVTLSALDGSTSWCGREYTHRPN